MTTDFYKGLEIFITGGSGVVGKAAIEKLLRSCDVKTIYILLRSKKGVSVPDRLTEIKKSRIFKVLKENKPNELDKLVAIPGDTALDGLGISAEHREMMKNVSVFFHSAATTRFDEPLRQAIRLNLKATLEAIKIAETLKNLKIFMHISTFFCNPHLKYIQDKIYPAVFDWRTAIKMLDSDKDEMEPVWDIVTDKVITGYRNTYLFTKNLTEQMVNDHRHKLPIAIYRPSIVINALEEPEPGFTETATGVMGVILIWGTGLMKVIPWKSDITVDLTPLDFGTKMLLIFTARSAQTERQKIKDAIPVGMFSSTKFNRYTLGDLGYFLTSATFEYPYEKSFWIPGMRLDHRTYSYALSVFFLQIIPSFLIDYLLKIFHQKPFMMKIQRRIHVSVNALDFFFKNNFKTDGTTDFEEIQKTEEGTPFDIGGLRYCCSNDDKMLTLNRDSIAGCRKFLLNEDESSLPLCRKILKGKIIAYNILRGYLLYVVCCTMYPKVMEYFSE